MMLHLMRLALPKALIHRASRSLPIIVLLSLLLGGCTSTRMEVPEANRTKPTATPLAFFAQPGVGEGSPTKTTVALAIETAEGGEASPTETTVALTVETAEGGEASPTETTAALTVETAEAQLSSTPTFGATSEPTPSGTMQPVASENSIGSSPTNNVTTLQYEVYAINAEFSPDGQYILATDRNDNVHVLEVDNGREVSRIPARVTFSPNNKYVGLIRDDIAIVWSFPDGQEVSRASHDGPMSELVFSPDGQYFATNGDHRGGGTTGPYIIDRTARVWETTTGREVMRVTYESAVRGIAFSPDGKYLVTVGGNAFGDDGLSVTDATVRVWEILSGDEVMSFERQATILGDSQPLFSPDGQYLAVADASLVHVWAFPSGQEIIDLPHEAEVEHLAFSRDGHHLATWSAFHAANPEYSVYNVQAWELPTGKALIHLDHTMGFLLSPQGRYMITDTMPDPFKNDTITRLWEISSGKEIDLSEILPSFTLSQDEHYALDIVEANIVRIWELATRSITAQIGPLPDRNIKTVAFSPDNRYLITKGRDTMKDAGLIQVWSWNLDQSTQMQYSTPTLPTEMADETATVRNEMPIELAPGTESVRLSDVIVQNNSDQPQEVFDIEQTVCVGWTVRDASEDDIVTIRLYYDDIMTYENPHSVWFDGNGTMRDCHSGRSQAMHGRAEVIYKGQVETVVWEVQ